MNARHLEEDLSAYLAGELTAAERQEAESHLHGCADCRARLDRLRDLDRLMSGVPPLEPSSDFLESVHRRIESDRRVISFRSRTTIAWVAAAAAVIFLVFLFRTQTEVRKPSTMVETPKVTSPQDEPQAPSPTTSPEIPTAVLESQVPNLTPEEVEMIAHLDALQEMELIEDYENLQNLDIAVLASGEEVLQ